MASPCAFDKESSFGPVVAPCRRAFDFTLYFEEAILVLVPSCLFTLVTIARLFILLGRPHATPNATLTHPRHSLIYLAKQLVAVSLIALHITVLILICTTVPRRERTAASIPSAVLSLLALILLPVLTHFEHRRQEAKPSLIVGLYLCVTILVRSVIVRTWSSLYPTSGLAPVGITLISLQLVLIVLGEYSWRPDALPSTPRGLVSDEELAGFLGRSGCSWLLRLLLTGYQRKLSSSDLGVIDSSLASWLLSDSFKHILPVSPPGSSSSSRKSNGRYRLLLALFRGLGFYAFAPVIPRLCLTGFTFAQPFLATATIDYIGSVAASENAGYGLIGASFLVYTGIAVSTGWYWSLAYKSITKIRGGLVDGVSRKMLRLSPQGGTESKVLTVMIADVHRITTSLVYVHEIWVAPIETAIGTWLLCRQVGLSGLAVLALIAVCTGASTYVGKHMATQQGVWLGAIEKRIGATKKMLASIKAIKMMALSQTVSEALGKLRSLEFAASKLFRALIVGSLISSYSTVTLAPVLVFGAYIGATGSTGAFDASTLFSSLILISLLASPLIRLLQIIPSFGAALGSLERVDAFFDREELIDTRGSGPAVNKTSQDDEKEMPDDKACITISNGHFGFANDKPILQRIDLTVNRGQHVVITGPAGCGKSLLLQTLLGEVSSKNNGQVNVAGRVAFCSQTPWLENITAQSTVSRFEIGEDHDWRERVVDACELRHFLQSQELDSTIGSQGSRLSGGERQRLALARAILSRPDVLLLDDVFSPIDYMTKIRMLKKLFGQNGLLRETSTTVVHVTQDHAIARIADTTLRLDTTGTLEHYQFPLSSTKLEEFEHESSDDADDKKEESQVSVQGIPEDKSRSRQPKADPSDIPDREVYRTYFHSIGSLNVWLFIGGGVIFAFCLKFPDVWVRWWSADASLNDPVHSVSYWFGLYAMLNVLPLISVAIWVAHLMLRIVPASGTDLHKTLVDTVFKAKFSFISSVDTGSLINRFNQDLMFVDSKLPLDLLNTVAALFTCVSQVILIGVSAVYVLATLPALAVALFVIQHFYLRTSKQLRQLDLQSKAQLHTRLSESYQGLATIRAHNWQPQMHREFQESLDRSQEPVYLLWMVQTWLKLVLNMVVAGLAVVVMGVAVALRRDGSITSSSAIGIAFLNLTSLGETMTNLLASWTSLETSLGAIARIKAFSRDTPQETQAAGAPLPPSWSASGGIRLENVWATYDEEGLDEKDKNWTLQDISLEVQPGERVAVCGRTGSGKSTLLLALLGLVEVPRGKIWVGSRDISEISGETLRSALHVIPQDSFSLVAGGGETLRVVLDPDRRLADKEIAEILKDCAMMDKVESLGGLSASVSDQLNLSVGESQLLVLARLICRAGSGPQEGGILLFDEATSSLDIDTERKIAEVMRKRLPNMTVVSVLHRLEAAVKYDRIMVLEGGRLVHVVTPTESTLASDIFSSIRQGSQEGHDTQT